MSRTVIFDEASELAFRNRSSRARGQSFEGMIDTACEFYALVGVAEIEKTPEPRRVIGRTGGRNSKMICVNEKKAQPDYKGTLSGGRSIVFEAKHTDKDRIEQSRVNEEQEKRLNNHEKLGALCFVVVSFGYERFFRVPWADWKRMKELYGRKYIKAEDFPGDEISVSEGVVAFLAHIP